MNLREYVCKAFRSANDKYYVGRYKIYNYTTLIHRRLFVGKE